MKQVRKGAFLCYCLLSGMNLRAIAGAVSFLPKRSKTTQSSPQLDGMPHCYNPQADEERIVKGIEEIDKNMAYRWFLGYSLNEELPHFSTVSYNFRHRYTEETIEQAGQHHKKEAGAAEEGGHEWYKYVYDEYYDCITCMGHTKKLVFCSANSI